MTRHYLQLIVYKAWADLKVEAARGYLGMLWWILEPILYMGAFYVVFGIALERGGPGFVPYLLTGLVVWKWFASTVKMSANAINTGRGLMAQVYLPKYFFPSVVTLRNSVKFLVSLVLLVGFILVYGIGLEISWISLPVVIGVQLLLIAGTGFLLAAIIPMWPDLMLVVNNGLMLMFFLSGIFFDISRVTGWVGDLLNLNPMVHVINAYRSVLLDGEWPDWSALIVVAGVSAILLWIGLRLLQRYDRLYPRLV